MKKYIICLFFTAFYMSTNAQQFQLFKPGTQWILQTSKIEKKNIIFTEYDPAKVDLNTMIWSFLPGGLIEYDYQSSEDVFACAGVDFLDMDITECRWEYDPIQQTVTLLIKGGYASIDDFVFKRKYKVEIKDDDKDNYGYILKKEVEYFFNDLTIK